MSRAAALIEAMSYLSWGWVIPPHEAEPPNARPAAATFTPRARSGLRRPALSDGGRLRVGDGRRQVRQERVGPGPGGAVVLADRAVAGGLDPER